MCNKQKQQRYIPLGIHPVNLNDRIGEIDTNIYIPGIEIRTGTIHDPQENCKLDINLGPTIQALDWMPKIRIENEIGPLIKRVKTETN